MKCIAKSHPLFQEFRLWQFISNLRIYKKGGVNDEDLTDKFLTKEEDFVENMFVCSTHDDILFFTNFGKVHMRKAYRIPEASRTAKGTNLVNIIELQDGEYVTAIIPIAGALLIWLGGLSPVWIILVTALVTLLFTWLKERRKA